MKLATLATLATLAAVGAGCSDSADGADGEGTVSFSTWGEAYIEQEIPPKSAEGEVIVEDGWTIRYTKFLIVLADVTVAEPGEAPAARLVKPKLFDMHAPGHKSVAIFAGLPGKAYTHVSYAVAPQAADADLGEGATEDDRRRMVAGGYSVYVEGTLLKEATTKSFAWGFATDTLYDACKGEISGKATEGVVVTNGGTDAVELTIHGDHLFYDDLQSPEAKLRVDNIANADTDGDGAVTLDELAAVDLADERKITAGPYGTGSAAHIHDLRAFVEALSRTVGHFRGEGECLARAR